MLRLTAEWTRLETRRRWRSLLALALLVAISTATVLTAVAGARRGQTSLSRLVAGTLPATVTVLPNQPGFDWARVRALPEVAAVSTFAVAGYEIDGYPLASQETGFPPGNDTLMRTIERPYVLAGRVFNPRDVHEVVVTGLFPRYYGKGVGDALTIQLPTVAQAEQGWDPSSGQAKGPRIRVRIVGIVRSPWLSDSVGSHGGVQVTPAMLSRYPGNFLGPERHGVRSGYVNALIRLKGGEKAIPRFRADLARVTGRSDIDVWDNLVAFGQPAQRTINYEAACLLAFGMAALAAALFLVGQSVARFAAASVADLQLLRAPGITPGEAALAASASPFLAAAAGAVLGTAMAIVASGWMPIGAASLVEPHPGISADWALLAPAVIIVPVLVLLGSLAAARRAVAASRAARRRPPLSGRGGGRQRGRARARAHRR